MDPKNFIGRAEGQVTEYLNTEVFPLLEKNNNLLNMKGDVKI